jgi:hypothetical protein
MDPSKTHQAQRFSPVENRGDEKQGVVFRDLLVMKKMTRVQSAPNPNPTSLLNT